jgi:Helicase conserved C-terminal domain/PLD-like domain/SNF2-related domain
VPRIFDNIDAHLLPALRGILPIAYRADFCVGYFNLRGWRTIDDLVDGWIGGDNACCRLLIGMHQSPDEELRAALRVRTDGAGIDQQAALRLKKRMAEEFREQLILGAPTDADEAGLRRLRAQLLAKKLAVRLFLRHTLHAKLYLAYREDPVSPIVGFLGSSNLTFAGLSKQGELNVDVVDLDACTKLQNWFTDRWNDRWCVDISDELAAIVEESWAREKPIPPYLIYLKIAYHLSGDARAGLSEFRLPTDLKTTLFEFQAAAVKIAAHHLNKRGGVLIGDVVGLGKTLIATALARILQDDQGTETLIICPKNLVPMWEDYVQEYRLIGHVLSLSQVIGQLPTLRRYRVVLIDESQNLRNREGRRFRAIQEYISQNDSRCILLSATPYNKTYLDLSAQLRLFVPEDLDLGIRPERKLREVGETAFVREHQCSVRSLAAFEHSEYADDWRDLMRLYLVRRTRSFIQENYSETDPLNGRHYLTFPNGTRSYFPTRVPKRVGFTIVDDDPSDQYARLYSDSVVLAIDKLLLPRYGLGTYLARSSALRATDDEKRSIQGLSRAGRRLMGFCRTNLFKRLESGGPAFIQSLERHALRNFVVLHALENGLPIPLGPQDAELLDTGRSDEDAEGSLTTMLEDAGEAAAANAAAALRTEADFRRRAAAIYAEYAGPLSSRFKWLRSAFFSATLGRDLLSDARALIAVLDRCGSWDADRDAKLAALFQLLTVTYPDRKVLVFSQFADTVRYLVKELHSRDVMSLEGATGASADPTRLAWRFSPRSNGKANIIAAADELRLLIATDVLSEGQNLQDCAIIVNFDLPWAIIRLIQRAGRVDRIGQQADTILCYSFLPADGIERIIRLRQRVRERLKENAEVVGTDESFFDDETDLRPIVDIYNERAGILDGDAETEVDLGSYAYQIWKNAIDRDPSLKKTVEGMPNVVYSTKRHTPLPSEPMGVLVYARTGEGNDALAWIDENGRSITESQLAILRAAACGPDALALERRADHHELVRVGVEQITVEEKQVGGQLGRPSGARFRTYERLQRYYDDLRRTSPLLPSAALERAIDDIYRYPLRQTATDTLNRQIRSGIRDDELADLVIRLRDEDRLSRVSQETETNDPQIICSLGLA